MVRSELVARIAAQNPHLFVRDAEAIVETILATMTDALAQGGRVELRGFGVFEAKRREARIRRNPRSQTEVEVPESIAIGFKPSRTMRDLLNPPVRSRKRPPKRLLRASWHRRRYQPRW